MTAETKGYQSELIHHALYAAKRFGVSLERDVLGPAAYRAQFDEFVTRRRDAFEGLFKAVGVVAVGMPTEPISERHTTLFLFGPESPFHTHVSRILVVNRGWFCWPHPKNQARG